MKALSFSALRRMNPNVGMSDILMEREKGLGSKGYLQRKTWFNGYRFHYL
jgi:hypothetical protein